MAGFARRLKVAQQQAKSIEQLARAEDELKKKLIAEAADNQRRLEALGREFESLQKGCGRGLTSSS